MRELDILKNAQTHLQGITLLPSIQYAEGNNLVNFF